MDKKKELSDEDRYAIVALHKHGGWTQKRIAKCINCTQSTVSDTLKRYSEQGDVKDHERIGRPALLDITNSGSNPLTKVVKNNRTFNALQIQNELKSDYNIHLSYNTIRRLRRKLGFRPVQFRRRPKFGENTRRRRLQYALDNLDEDWKNIIFTDESWFILGNNNMVVWKRPDEEPIEAQVKQHPDKVMVWAGIWWDGRTKLCIIDGNVDGEKYREILYNYIIRPHLNEDEKQVLQDGARAHTSAETLEYCDEHDVSIKQNPPSSPELNPIEKAWNWIKHEVNKINPSSLEELITVIQQVWDSIPQDTIQSFISHTSTVCNDIIASGGGTISEPNRHHKKLRGNNNAD